MYIEPPCKSGGGRKYDSIKCDQDFIGILRLVKELVFNFDGNKELTHAMWESYASLFQCRQHIFDMNQKFSDRFNKSASIIIQYDGSIRKSKSLINYLGSKEDVQ